MYLVFMPTGMKKRPFSRKFINREQMLSWIGSSYIYIDAPLRHKIAICIVDNYGHEINVTWSVMYDAEQLIKSWGWEIFAPVVQI